MSGGSHSSNLELLDQEASMQNIDRLVEALEMEAKESGMSKVPPFEVEAEFLKLTSRKYKKDVWQDIAPWSGFSLTHSQPRSKGWVMDDFKKFSLEGHPDDYALDKVEWDNEKGELVLEREALKEELNKAKEMAIEVEQCKEAFN
ncbi:hypothetical protein R1flu_027502 [Riccia fluitans]|uniref:Uncharacterized protein n=1 Tax=Riccia fluitans TaxID=41844 RepID=A0ABD1XJ07_9MARC